MATKVVINICIEGFSLSEEAYKFLGLEWDEYGYGHHLKRTDARLVQCVEELGDRADGMWTKLKIVEIPEGVEWEITTDETGAEQVEEKHRIWN